MTAPETIKYSVWVKRGPMLIRRDALDNDDPDQLYNYIKTKYGVDPEEYGIKRPPLPPCPTCGRT